MKGLTLLLLILMASSLMGQTRGEYIPMVHADEKEELNYNILYPSGFSESSDKKYPLLVFLHGAGERGSDNKAQLIHGSSIIKDSISKYPAIVIFPQCPKDDYWVNLESEGEGQARNMKVVTEEGPNPSLRMVMDLINTTLKEDYVDEERLYIAGLSMGGMGTIELGWRMKDQIAAAIAICGVGPKEKARYMTKVPFWFIHGIDDNVVPSRYSINMVKAMQVSGGMAKITLYENTGHNSWDKAFRDPDFFSFMFNKSRKQ